MDVVHAALRDVAVVDRARYLASSWLEAVGKTGPPVDVDEVAAYLGYPVAWEPCLTSTTFPVPVAS